MNRDCSDFRAHLERRLGGTANAFEPEALAWREHLDQCAACSELLASEEALDLLLATLPEPHLPPALARRVLARLASARATDAALERLLDLSRPVHVPAGLAARVLSRLDREVVSGMHRDDSDRTRAHRPGATRATGADRITPTRGRRNLVRSLSLAAALVLLAAGAWVLRGLFSAPPRGVAPKSAPGIAQDDTLDAPSDELLGSLDVLESWDLLRSDDLDAALLSLEPIDEVLLELESSDGSSAELPPSKG